MKRRTRRILWIGLGIPVALVIAAVAILLLSGGDPETTLSSIDVKEFPSDWTTEDVAPVDELDPPETVVPEPVIAPPTIESMGLPLSGTLVMTGDGEPFGEERYTLSLQESVVVMDSVGEFWFKALIATISIAFEQSLEMDRQLRPRWLTAAFDGPLGFDRALRADVGTSSVAIISGDETRQVDLQRDDVFIVNTFSTYALVPLLFELRQPDKRIDVETLLLGGPPSSDDEESDAALPVMTVERVSDGIIRYEDRDLSVDRYRISGETGDMVLYARGTELLGVYAGGEDGSLFIYRADYFNGGFEVPAADLVGSNAADS